MALSTDKNTILSDEQRMFAMRVMGDYVDIVNRYSDRPISSPDPTHSALLHWMLAGNDPLPKPPPCLMSRPQHGLATGDVLTLLDPPIKLPEGDVLVGQNRHWEWESVSKGLLRHKPSDVLYHWNKDENTLQLASNLE